MQCTGIIRAAFPGESEQPKYGATQLFILLCAVCSCVHTTGCEAYYFTTHEYGIFNVRTNVGACRSHERGSGTNKSAQELTRRDSKKTLVLTLPRQGIETQGLRI